MNTWILIFYLIFSQPTAPMVISGFATEADCEAAAEYLHDSDYRLAPFVVSVCIPARLAAK